MASKQYLRNDTWATLEEHDKIEAEFYNRTPPTLEDEKARSVTANEKLIQDVKDEIRRMIDTLGEFAMVGLIYEKTFRICKEALEGDINE